MKKVAIYARVSTTEQNVENQLHDLRRYCESRGLEIVRTFEDTGISGAKQSRPALDQLMTEAKEHKFDAVLVWRFDRFARSTSHLLQALQTFMELGIEFVSYTEGIDTSSPVGKMISTFIFSVAEYERSLLISRVKCSLEYARSKGVKLGRPAAGFDIAKALKMKSEGVSMSKMSKVLGVSEGTLFRGFKAIRTPSKTPIAEVA